MIQELSSVHVLNLSRVLWCDDTRVEYVMGQQMLNINHKVKEK